MTSGVYLIEFPSGAQYIGKSIDIDKRWKQHLDKMNKGTAAKPMQAEWNKYQDFNASVLLMCHEDHIDVVEAHYINRFKPSLNTSIPKDPYAHMTYDEVDTLFGSFTISAEGHVVEWGNALRDIEHLKSKIRSLEAEVEDLEDNNDMLMKKRTDEEMLFDVECKILGLEQQLKHKSMQVDQLDRELRSLKAQIEYYQLPWWKRWFR